jgi:MCP family monocarboxylic acid transporter-like MFS transporter 10
VFKARLTMSRGGFLADRVGRLNFLWPMGLLGGFLCLFLWLLGDTIAILVVFVGMYGFAASNINALPASAVGQITPDGSLGARIGAFYSVIAVASLVGTPIGGALITDKNTKDGYRWLIVFSVSGNNSSTPNPTLTTNRAHHSPLARSSCLQADCCMTEI